MTWVREQLEHDWFIPKDTWRIFDSKGLVDFFHQKWQMKCRTGATIKHVQRLNNIFKLILHSTILYITYISIVKQVLN